jgi:hypothetical protein
MNSENSPISPTRIELTIPSRNSLEKGKSMKNRRGQG